jgi:hypothetical protein
MIDPIQGTSVGPRSDRITVICSTFISVPGVAGQVKKPIRWFGKNVKQNKDWQNRKQVYQKAVRSLTFCKFARTFCASALEM